MQLRIGNVQFQGHLGLLRHTPLKHFRHEPSDHSVAPRTLWQQIRMFEIKRANASSTGTTTTVTHVEDVVALTGSPMQSTVTSKRSKEKQRESNSSANSIGRPKSMECDIPSLRPDNVAKFGGEFEIPDVEVQQKVQHQQIRDLTQRIADKFQLSTTGYQSAMDRLNNAQKSDEQSLMTMSRAQQYSAAAKLAHPSKTLFNLAKLQADYIYRTSSNELLGAIEMQPEQITECLIKCRETGFANCDMQALEVALQLRYGLGIADFTIVSNHNLSHNYVVIHPCSSFPKGAIVDSWTGHGLLELNLRTKLKFSHREGNFVKNEYMHEWLEKYGSQYFVNDASASHNP